MKSGSNKDLCRNTYVPRYHTPQILAPPRSPFPGTSSESAIFRGSWILNAVHVFRTLDPWSFSVKNVFDFLGTDFFSDLMKLEQYDSCCHQVVFWWMLDLAANKQWEYGPNIMYCASHMAKTCYKRYWVVFRKSKKFMMSNFLMTKIFFGFFLAFRVIFLKNSYLCLRLKVFKKILEQPHAC